MSFNTLLTVPEGRIALVNFYRMIDKGLVDHKLATTAIKAIFGELSTSPAAASWDALKSKVGAALLPLATDFQVQGNERLADGHEISAVVGFDKVRKLLKKIVQRTRKHHLRVQTLTAPGARPATVAASADLINRYSKSMPDFTLSEWGTIFWATPSSEVDRLQALCTQPLPSEELATRFRDAFGLVQNPGVPIKDHIFLFRGHISLKALRKVEDLEFQYARPTALDGWDNKRFCQATAAAVPVPGCGLTIDLENWSFAPGAAELVSTPLPLKYFQCHYVGRLKRLKSGSDDDFLSLLLEADDLARIVSVLDTIASS